jgi:hypothetical protein
MMSTPSARSYHRILDRPIAQQLPVHVSDGDVVTQKANINLATNRRDLFRLLKTASYDY